MASRSIRQTTAGRGPGRQCRADEGEYPEQVDSLAKGIQQFSWDWTRNKIWTLADHPGNRVVWAFEP